MKNKNLPDNAIEIKELSKKYKGIGGAKDLLALDSIDLRNSKRVYVWSFRPKWCWKINIY